MIAHQIARDPPPCKFPVHIVPRLLLRWRRRLLLLVCHTPLSLCRLPAQSAPPAVSVSPAANANAHGHEEHLVSALHAALRSISGHHHHPPSTHDDVYSVSHSPPQQPSTILPLAPPPPRDTHATKLHTSLEIQVASDSLVLRGAGVDVEPALLTGNVVLTLSEPTSIPQVTLLFRRKARVPAGGTTSDAH